MGLESGKDRKKNMEYRTFGRPAFRGNITLMVFDHFLNNGEPDSGAFEFGISMQACKNIEYAPGIALLETNAIIPDRDKIEFFISFRTRMHLCCFIRPDFPAADVDLRLHPGPAVFERIANQVLEYLLQLPEFSINRGQFAHLHQGPLGFNFK